MRRLSHQDTGLLLEAVGKLYAQTDFGSLPRLMVDLQRDLVPCDISAYNEIDTARGELRTVDDFPHPDEARRLFPQFMEYRHEHPISNHLARTNSRDAVMIPDFLTQTQFQRLGLFNEFYRPFGIRYQLVFFLPQDAPCLVAMGLSRLKRDFTERDRLVFNHLKLHFDQAWQNARALMLAQREAGLCAQVLARERRGLVFLDREFQITGAGTLAMNWLEEYFGPDGAKGAHLPGLVRRWIQRLSSNGHKELACRIEGPLAITRGDRRLVIRWISHGTDGSSALVLTEVRETLSASDFTALGLTAREGEVLRWLAEGKSNPEIGAILGTSTNTVRKHVEHILAKLRVESRAGAMKCVWEMLSED